VSSPCHECTYLTIAVALRGRRTFRRASVNLERLGASPAERPYLFVEMGPEYSRAHPAAHQVHMRSDLAP